MLKKFFKKIINTSFYIVALGGCTFLGLSGVSQNIDLLIFDSLKTRFPKKYLYDSPSIVVGISESDIEKYGWPIDDKYLLQTIQKLDKAESSSIVLDLYRNVGVGEGAKSLANYSRSNKKVISIFNVAESIPSIPKFPLNRMAFNDMPIDTDNVLRRDLVGVDRKKYNLSEEFVSVPMRMIEIRQLLNKKNFDLEDKFYKKEIPLIKNFSGGYTNVDANGFQIFINYPDKNYIPIYSLGDILEDKISSEKLKNKMVVIGATAPSLKDVFAIPSSRFETDSKSLLISGAEIHAHRANQLLELQNNSPLKINTINPLMELIGIIFYVSFITIFIEKTKKISTGFIVVLTSLGFLSLLIYFAFINGYWIEFALPVIGVIAFSSISWLRKASEQQKQKALMQKLLGQTTSPEVAEELWNQKDSLLENGRFPGTELPVTILFSDTVSFSSVSENMNPTELLDWLNRGMEKFVKIISENGGMVNKFTGDGFLAVFGAPVKKTYEQSSNEAIKTAMEIRGAIENLKNDLEAEGLPLIKLRIGIHSGKIITGSMGGSEKIEYALIGDSVNVAARLESLNKENMKNNCRILVSKESLEFANSSDFNLEEWGPCKVKGRESLVEVFEII
ncbi:CHASE2 domain-containing protein [Prochlorococcus sp. AH-716-M06]|nr:CHASE2 domain-containing protein [Prochlorococcus sp. AH-716-M06]